MIEFQEFPKMIYHPETNAPVIVRDADHEAEQLEVWGVNDAPKISLKSAAPEASPKPRASRTAKKAAH
jgi:hypothetical protein